MDISGTSGPISLKLMGLHTYLYTTTRAASYISGLGNTKCCQVQSDISIGKVDIFEVIRTQKVLTYERFLYC